MKTLALLVIASVCAVLIGCNGHSTPGGPGASGTNTKPSLVGSADNTFTLKTPTLNTDIKQGETKTVAISISRGKNFDQDVKLEIAGMPPGVKVTPASPELKASEEKVDISVEAAKDAALGEHVLTITGMPAREGAKAAAQLKINVKKAD
jgi:uncharacterized membrane protein